MSTTQNTRLPFAPLVRRLGRVAYPRSWQAMQDFTAARKADTADEIWLLEHEPVFTLGRNADPAHVLDTGDIPLLGVDRGGQVTYHGPGQLMAYLLLDIRRRRLGVRELVSRMERAIINLLADHGVAARARADAPGVYVGEAKIAALGLRVKGGCSYHGLSFNVAMDMAPFARINPCGYAGMPVCQLADFVADPDLEVVAEQLLQHLRLQLQ